MKTYSLLLRRIPLRILFTLSLFLYVTLLSAQSNKAGTIHTSITLDGLLGFSSPSFTYNTAKPVIKDNATGVGVGFNIGAKVSVGVSEKISVGFFLRKEGSSYVNTTDDKKHTYDVKGNGFGFAPEVKIYLANTDKLNVYFAPSIGYSSSNDKITLDEKYILKGKSSGVNYAAILGFNKYFSESMGFSVDFGYQGYVLKGKGQIANNLTYWNVNACILLNAGLVFKIN